MALVQFSFACEREKDTNDGPMEPVQIELSDKEQEVVESTNEFGIDIFTRIAEDEPADKNIFISPTSIALALAMTRNGARNETEEAMETGLHMSGLSSEDINSSFKTLIEGLTGADAKVILDIANSIWYRQGYVIEEEFLEVNEEYYNAEITALDFDSPEAPDIINDWVAENTNNKIPDIVDEINPDHLMFLINAIYFNGTWTTEFNSENTRESLFYLTGDNEVQVEMMNYQEPVGYFENELLQAAELDYGRGNFSMVVLLPRPDYTVDDILEQMTSEQWNNWMASFNDIEVDFYLPKFSFDYEKELNQILSLMGMEIAFDPDNADFSGIINDIDLYISKVKHKGFVEVDEEGTEAAAVTSVEISFTSVPDQLIMNVNRPFIFAIREKTTNAIVFFGRLAVPE